MAALPGNVNFGTVFGHFAMPVRGTPHPTGTPAQGTVTLTPTPKVILDAGASPKTTFIPVPITIALDINGYFGSPSGVEFVSNEDPDLNPGPGTWDYKVTTQFTNTGGIQLDTFYIDVPLDGVVDMTDARPVSDGDGVFYTVGPAGPAGGILTTEDYQDLVAAMAVAGSGMTITYNDGAGTLTFASSGGYNDEQARDAIGAALVGGTGVTVTVDDAGNTITLATTAYVPAGADVAVTDGGTGRSTSTTAYGLIAAGTTATGVQQTIGPGTSGQFLKSAGASALGAFAGIVAADVSDFSTAADARITAATGVSVQALNANLSAIAGLTTGPNKVIYWNGLGTAATTDLTVAGRTLIGGADADAQLATLGGTAATGTGAVVRATSPTLVTPALGTPASGTLTNATGLPIATGVSGLATGVATFLATPSSANLIAAVTDETGTGALVFANTPTLVTPKFTSFTNGLATITPPSSTSTLATLALAETLTNKRIQPKFAALTVSGSTFTPNLASGSSLSIAPTAAFTIANPTGTPTDYEKLELRITDDGTARGITWGSQYVGHGAVLPSTTVGSTTKPLTILAEWNVANSEWQVFACAQKP